MKKQHLLSALFLGFLLALCSPAFAQYKIEDLSARADLYDIQNSVQHYKYSNYYLLTKVERWIYDTIYPAISNAEPTAILPYYSTLDDDVDGNAINNAVNAIRIDHPEFGWIDNYYKSSRYVKNSSGNYDLEITFAYNSLASNAKYYQREFEAAAEKLLSYARRHKTLVEQERYIFDYLKSEIAYVKSDLDQTGYATLVMKSAVCGGFAITFNYLMERLGIPSYYVLGYTDNGVFHAWNLTYINGRWVYVDTTTTKNGIQTRYQLAYSEERTFNHPINDSFHASPTNEYFPTSRMPI